MDLILSIINGRQQKSTMKQYLSLNANNSCFKFVKNKVLEISMSNYQNLDLYNNYVDSIDQYFIESTLDKKLDHTLHFIILNKEKIDLTNIYDYQTVYLTLKKHGIKFEVLDFIRDNDIFNFPEHC